MVGRKHMMILLCIVVLVSLAVASNGELVPFDPVNMSYPVSSVQATTNAQTWLQDPGIQLSLQGVENAAAIASYSHRYVLCTTDGTQELNVDCYTGEVRHWQNTAERIAYLNKLETLDPSTKLPPADLSSIAAQFLSTKYIDFLALNMQPVNASYPNSRYAQLLPPNVWYFGNTARCVVDEWSGNVVEYFGTHAPAVTISVQPLISGPAAEQIAVDYCGTIQILDPDSPTGTYVTPQSAFVLRRSGPSVRTDPMALQRLVLYVRLVVHAGSGYTATEYLQELAQPFGFSSGQQLDVCVDAHTGEVISSEPGGYAGGGPVGVDKMTAATITTYRPRRTSRSSEHTLPKVALSVDGTLRENLLFPPLEVSDTGYIYVRYVTALYGGGLSWKNGTAILTVAGRSCTMRPGSKRMLVNGQSISLRQPARIVSGRLYVPCEAVKHICGATAVLDAERGQVRIQSGKIPLKASLRRPIARAAAD